MLDAVSPDELVAADAAGLRPGMSTQFAEASRVSGQGGATPMAMTGGRGDRGASESRVRTWEVMVEAPSMVVSWSAFGSMRVTEISGRPRSRTRWSSPWSAAWSATGQR